MLIINVLNTRPKMGSGIKVHHKDRRGKKWQVAADVPVGGAKENSAIEAINSEAVSEHLKNPDLSS